MRNTDPLANVRGWRWPALVGLAAALAAPTACFNSHVFDIVDPCEVEQQTIARSIEPATAADILIVVDNSGSMCEEQDNLVANFYNDNVNECPLADPAAYDLEEYQNPSDAVVQSDLAACGFIQILAAYDNDFRVGVITTDVGPCDNRFGLAAVPQASCNGETYPDWGRRPQRGCLQGPPGEAQKFLDPSTEDIGQKFAQILNGTRTYGSAFERGLDAVQMFLDPETERHDSCATDLDDFVRPEASLLVIFLTDEDDCSYVGSESFPDNTVGESCDNATEVIWSSRPEPLFPEWCYDRSEYLNPVSGYADFLKGYKDGDAEVRVAVIAGATKDPTLQPAGCLTDISGVPDGVCTPSKGNSNSTASGAVCDPVRLADEGLPPCCQADSGNRYYDLANSFPADQAFTDSICFESFRTTMRQLAQFAAKVDSVLLPEPPAVPQAINVEILRDGQTEPEALERIPDGADTDGLSGWQLSSDDQNNYRVSFYGDAVPEPGDDIAVYVLGEGDTAAGDAEPCIGFNSASNDGG